MNQTPRPEKSSAGPDRKKLRYDPKGVKIAIAALSALAVYGWVMMRFSPPSSLSQKPGQIKTEKAIDPQSSVPTGWRETGNPGVFYRWCEKKDNCSDPNNDIPRLEGQMEVWCRDEPCDLYVKVNWLDADGRVVDWSNDAGKGFAGEKVILRFPSFDGNAKTIRVTDFRSN